ncbi:hypothetical protein ACHAXT_010800 [Thalassiosira profunda]
MSRSFTPPDTLSDDDIRTVADVRRAVWINGLFGLGAGTAAGTTGHLVLQKLQKMYVPEGPPAAGKASEGGWIYRCLRPLPPLGKNTFLLSLLGGGALGSFVMSTTAGKNAVHLLHPIFNIGRNEHAGKSPYQIAISTAEEQDIDATTKSFVNEDDLDADHHRSRSLRRKASMKRRLESGHSLSDTHGNTWPTEVEETDEAKKDKAVHRAELWGRRQTNRRKTVRDRIEHGKALSNATGGHWSEESYGSVDGREEAMREKASHRAERWEQRQTNRRNTVRERIEHGRALSNSTGGHWSEEDNGSGDGK